MDLDRRGFLVGTAALALEQTLLPGEAKADVPRNLSWRAGVEWIFKATEKNKVEYGDGFMSLANGHTAWTDHQYTRERFSMRGKDYDWDTWKDVVSENGPIVRYVDVHSHIYGSPPSSVDVRALLAKDLILRKKWDADSVPARAFRSKHMKLAGLVLTLPKRQGWYFEIAAPETIKKLFPQATPVSRSYDLGDTEYNDRLSLVHKAVEQFAVTLQNADYDLAKARATPEGNREFLHVMRLYADVGILVKHMSSGEVQKGPPGSYTSPSPRRKK